MFCNLIQEVNWSQVTLISDPNQRNLLSFTDASYFMHLCQTEYLFLVPYFWLLKSSAVVFFLSNLSMKKSLRFKIKCTRLLNYSTQKIKKNSTCLEIWQSSGKEVFWFGLGFFLFNIITFICDYWQCSLIPPSKHTQTPHTLKLP